MTKTEQFIKGFTTGLAILALIAFVSFVYLRIDRLDPALQTNDSYFNYHFQNQ